MNSKVLNRPWRVIAPGDRVQAKNGGWLDVRHITRQGPDMLVTLGLNGQTKMVRKPTEERVSVVRGEMGEAADLLARTFRGSTVLEGE